MIEVKSIGPVINTLLECTAQVTCCYVHCTWPGFNLSAPARYPLIIFLNYLTLAVDGELSASRIARIKWARGRIYAFKSWCCSADRHFQATTASQRCGRRLVNLWSRLATQFLAPNPTFVWRPSWQLSNGFKWSTITSLLTSAAYDSFTRLSSWHLSAKWQRLAVTSSVDRRLLWHIKTGCLHQAKLSRIISMMFSRLFLTMLICFANAFAVSIHFGDMCSTAAKTRRQSLWNFKTRCKPLLKVDLSSRSLSDFWARTSSLATIWSPFQSSLLKNRFLFTFENARQDSYGSRVIKSPVTSLHTALNNNAAQFDDFGAIIRFHRDNLARVSRKTFSLRQAIEAKRFVFNWPCGQMDQTTGNRAELAHPRISRQSLQYNRNFYL